MERIKSTDEYKVGLSDYAQDSYGDFVVVEIERMNEVVDKDGKYILMIVGQRGREPLEILRLVFSARKIDGTIKCHRNSVQVYTKKMKKLADGSTLNFEFRGNW